MKYRTELDGLRCLAVGMVLVAHLPTIQDAPLWNAVKWAGDALRFGYLGVDVFFVLSGFLITRLLLEQRALPRGTVLSRFFAKRFLRIFPVFYVTIAYCLLFADIPLREALFNFAYLSNYYYSFNDDSSPLRHSWSLSVEEQFYLFWPFVALFVPAKRLAVVISVGTVLIVGVSLVACALLFTPATFDLLVVRATFFRLLSLAAGALLAVHFERLGTINRWLPLAFACVVFPVLQALIRIADPPGASSVLLFVFTGWSVSIFLTVLLFASTRNPISMLFSSRIATYVGRFSYGLYLYHLVILHQLDLRESYRPEGAGALEVALALALIFAVSIASFELFEKPLLRLKDRLSPRALPPSGTADAGRRA